MGAGDISQTNRFEFDGENCMGIGIQICGLNGSGKSTLGRALAERLGFYFIDSENLCFSQNNADETYANPKPQEAIEKLLMKEVSENPNFVFAAVKGDYGKEIVPMYNYVVMVDVPKTIRLQRVRKRSFQKFGYRMLIDEDLYKREEAFFQMVESRKEDYVERWLKTLKCPIIRVDGTNAVDGNLEYIIKQMNI